MVLITSKNRPGYFWAVDEGIEGYLMRDAEQFRVTSPGTEHYWCVSRNLFLDTIPTFKFHYFLLFFYSKFRSEWTIRYHFIWIRSQTRLFYSQQEWEYWCGLFSKYWLWWGSVSNSNKPIFSHSILRFLTTNHNHNHVFLHVLPSCSD